eukprot:8793204-Pyramimonas_sp.AAC.1
MSLEPCEVHSRLTSIRQHEAHRGAHESQGGHGGPIGRDPCAAFVTWEKCKDKLEEKTFDQTLRRWASFSATVVSFA